MAIEFVRGKRTTLFNPNPGAARVHIATSGGTVLEFDLIVGGSFTMTAGPDVTEVKIEFNGLHQPPKAVG